MTVVYRGKWNLAAPTSSARSVAIVGGGASGVLMAAHLLRSGDAGLEVTIIEKRASLGRGLAYSTDLPEHVLNVRAANMSAFADDPDHFARWLKARNIPIDDPTTYFAPRQLYGEYLGELLTEPRQEGGPRLRVVDEECVEVLQRGGYLELRLSNGSSIVAQQCILATGHDRTANRGGSLLAPSNEQQAALPGPADRVLVLGTGLSMVDTCLSLLLRGHVGEIVAVSRRGLLPAVHKKTSPIVVQEADVPLERSLPEFVRWFRDLVRSTEARGGGWRDVVDGLRPHNQAIWRAWPAASRRQFFRHLKAWWDIHRHRMAPEAGERLSKAIASGQLRVIAGRGLDVTPDDAGFAARLRRRNSQLVEEIRVAHVYECAGVIADPGKSTNPLIRSLLAAGVVRADPLRIGLDVAADGALISREGACNDRIYAVGPVTRGTFLEIEAVPDIRIQCQHLAGLLVKQPASMRRA
ncbi:FAD/NAD(P)-binding protein [Mesorhizobium sp.]|uniref:FAD/NAD(P)-binding protein n=1 Tax=Mesorhizobium sp. TaxID=1871066 RepID=UPI000FE4EBDC|nr:MAG: FAD-dependent oxidoreductase [Mesorhizobium sp.]